MIHGEVFNRERLSRVRLASAWPYGSMRSACCCPRHCVLRLHCHSQRQCHGCSCRFGHDRLRSRKVVGCDHCRCAVVVLEQAGSLLAPDDPESSCSLEHCGASWSPGFGRSYTATFHRESLGGEAVAPHSTAAAGSWPWRRPGSFHFAGPGRTMTDQGKHS